jgi:hypothetical protein
MNPADLSNDELLRGVRNTRKLLKKPVIAFRKDWNQHFDALIAEAHKRGLSIKGVAGPQLALANHDEEKIMNRGSHWNRSTRRTRRLGGYRPQPIGAPRITTSDAPTHSAACAILDRHDACTFAECQCACHRKETNPD